MPLTFEPSTLLTAGGMVVAIAVGWMRLSFRIRRLEDDRTVHAATRKLVEGLDGRLKGQGERIGAATGKVDGLIGEMRGWAQGWSASEARARLKTAPIGQAKPEGPL